MRKCAVLLVMSGLAFGCLADELLEDCESTEGWKCSKDQCEKVAGAEAGGSSIKFTQPGTSSKSYPYDPLKRANWDTKYKGISFKVKGDGSDQFGSISIGGDYAWRYVYHFPVKSTEWTEYTVAWEDFTPEFALNQKLNSLNALPPSGIVRVQFGDRWEITHRNMKIPKFSYCVDDLKLVEKATPVLGVSTFKPRDFKDVAGLLKKGGPLSIVCLGDSITAGTSLPNADKERYANLLQDKLRAQLKTDKINAVSLAVGGAHLYDTTAWLNRDFIGEPPDLVTLMIGYNNKTAANSPAYFAQALRDFIDMFAAKTKGKTALLLIPTIPGKDYRFNMMDDYAQIVRDVAKELGLPVCDIQKVFKAVGQDKIADYFADMAHPNAKGHELFATTLTDFLIEAAGK